MNLMRFTGLISSLAGAAFVCCSHAAAQSLTPHQQLTRDIYQELIEINTVTATGDTLRAAGVEVFDSIAALIDRAEELDSGRCNP